MSFQQNAVSSTVAIVGSVTTTPPGLGSSQTVVNFTDSFTYAANTDSNRRSNTATKTFYINSLSLGNGSTAVTIQIKDNATLVWRSGYIPQGTTVVTFPTPLKITTNLTVQINAAQALTIAASGWEE